jgi:hypothetical protein
LDRQSSDSKRINTANLLTYISNKGRLRLSYFFKTVSGLTLNASALLI